MLQPKRDNPWLFRTYSGHSNAVTSNALYKTNLAKGQTGLSVAFDLPTQTGYDSDHPLARGEVGKVGVPICHIGDMQALFDGIPLDKMNTSMTINATAPWLLALYVVTAKRQGADVSKLQGTTQNDILKEYLSRGTYAFPPEPSLKLTTDVIAYAYKNLPKWNPVNVCPYHLQEAGATPVQELSYGLANAIAILDAVRKFGTVPAGEFPQVVGCISFFLDSGIRFIEEMCKTRAFSQLWKEICEERYGIDDEKLKRFRYGVQVNSLGLTEQQPENNIIRIVLEALGVTLSREARARAVQLPAWSEGLGLPRPWDQQWSLRIQQILAYETDLLEYDDLFSGSPVIAHKVSALCEAARAEMARIGAMGGMLKAIETGYVKSALVASNAKRIRDIEAGIAKVVGVNCFQETEPSPLSAGEGSVVKVDASAARDQMEKLAAFKKSRDSAAVDAALKRLVGAAGSGANVMEPSIACAEAGVTTGEWAEALRKLYGSYRAPTGVAVAESRGGGGEIAALREQLKIAEKKLGRKARFLVAKPGLDGHSNGAEQIAVRARDVGMEVIYQGIRLTPEEIAKTASEEDADVIGLSVLSGSHLELVPEILSLLAKRGLERVPVVVGGIIPAEDAAQLKNLGVRKIYTPKDYDLNKIISDILRMIA